MSLVPTVLVLALSVASVRSDGDEAVPSVLRTYDLTALRTTFDDGYSVPLHPAVRASAWSYTDEAWGDGADGDVAVLVDLLHAALGDELDYEGRWARWLDDGRFVVSAPEAVHERVAGLAAAFERATAASTELTIDVISLAPRDDAPLGPLVLAPGVYEQWLAEAERRSARRSSYRVTVRPGRTQRVVATRWVNVVSDVDVLIAEASVGYDPDVEMLEVGTTLYVRATPAADGLALALALEHATLEEGTGQRDVRYGGDVTADGIRRDVAGPRRLSTATAFGRTAALETFLAGDGVVLFETGAHLASGGGRVVVAVRRTGAVLEHSHSVPLDGGRTLEIVNLEGASLPGFELEGDVGGGQDVLPAPLHESGVILMANLRSSDHDYGLELLHMDDMRTERFGPWALRMPDEGAAAPVSSAAERLRASAETTELVELRVSLRRPGPSGAELVSARLATRLGSEAALVVGGESTALLDFEVEVATGASAPDPQPYMLFDGLVLTVRPTRSVGGNLLLDVRARGIVETARHELDLGSSSFAGLEQVAHDVLLVDERAVVPAGRSGARTLVFGDTGADTAGGLVLEVEVR